MKSIKIAILEDLREVAAHLQMIFNREPDMHCIIVNSRLKKGEAPTHPNNVTPGLLLKSFFSK